MEKIEKEHFTIEIYYNLRRLDAILIYLGAFTLINFIYWVSNPGRSMIITILVFMAIGVFISYVLVTIGIKKMQVILTRDAFILTELRRAIPWEDIDHVEYHPGKIRKILTVYYQKHNQITKLVTSLDTIEDREQFLKSLREFSKMYGFLIEEK
ncbi:MAG: hypothetical protein PVF58_11560 [Candidatus Methanofastidiosia archaeon]|jgi:hypothetical protein